MTAPILQSEPLQLMEDRMHRTLQRQGLLLGPCILLSLVACSVDTGVEDRGAAAVDPATAQLALRELAGSVDHTVSAFGTSATASSATSVAPNANPPPAGAVSFPCAAGGTANVSGYVNVAPSPVTVDVKVMIAYAACTSGSGTVIAGDIDFSQTVVAGPGAPLRIETLYQGDVVFSGHVNARCPIDLNVLVDETGAAVQVGGTFCGQDASTLDLQVSPRWSSR
jgi:hypothetical protein